MKQSNTDEALVPEYILPYQEVFQSLDTWESKKDEIFNLFQDEFYGKIPTQHNDVIFQTKDTTTDVVKNPSIAKNVTVGFANTDYSFNMKVYLPVDKKIKGIFLRLNFADNEAIHDNEARIKRAAVQNRKIQRMLSEDFGCAIVVYGDILADNNEAFINEYKNIQKASGDNIPIDKTSAICIWAWGIMRMCDYFKQNKETKDSPLFAFGHSRLGKTSLWASVNDDRISYTISNNSGCGGAALSRRCFGETIHLMNKRFPHWLCKNAKKYDDNENSLPIEQHLLLALIAPRPLYVASASKDSWADPVGEFTSSKLASRIYSLYGYKSNFGEFPTIHSPVGGTIRYHLREGDHGESEYDWDRYIDFAMECFL